MAGQQICLKWNSFQSTIVSSFENLWEEEGLVDVTLASDGQCIRAHKVILSACSPFFKQVFQNNPCQHPVIILQDVHYTELESLLCFVYKGEVNIDQENLPALLRAAETLQIRGLSGASEQLKEKMSFPKKFCGEDFPESQPPVKRQRSFRQSQSPPLPITPLALTPARSRHFSSSSADGWDQLRQAGEPDVPTKLEPEDNNSTCPSPPLEESREAISLNLSMETEKISDTDTGQLKGTSKSEVSTFHADPNSDSTQVSKNFPYPPFPCPFCDRAYTSWGFRRRHIKALHTQSQQLSCKWCMQILPSHAEWEKHTITEHKLSEADAHNGLLILEEAHMVLQIPNPTRLDTFVNMIKKNSESCKNSSNETPKANT